MAGEVTGGADALPVPEEPDPLPEPSVGGVNWLFFQTGRKERGSY